MYPILGRIGPITFYSYGLALAIAFVAAAIWVRRECRKRSIPAHVATDLMLAAAIGGIVGARLFFVAAHWSYFMRNPFEMVKLQQGGLVFYGGLAGGAAAVAIVARLRGLSLADTADMAAPAVALGSAIGRVGCLLNGCCYGRLTSGPFGIAAPPPAGGSRYPTQMLDGAYNLAIFILLAVLAGRKYRPGFLFWLYAAIYSLFRFAIEFLRDNQALVGGLSGAQVISIGVFALAAIVLITKYRRVTGGLASSGPDWGA